MGKEIVAAIGELPIQRYNRIQRIVYCDVHHGVSAYALKSEELIFSKRDLIHSPVPRDNQCRIQKEDLLQLSECRVFMPSLLLVRKALVQACFRLLCHSRDGRRVGYYQQNCTQNDSG